MRGIHLGIWFALLLAMIPFLGLLALSATLISVVGCEPGEVTKPVPVKPSVQRIDSKCSDRYVFAFDSSDGDFMHGLWKSSGIRTYTRISDQSVADLFDIVDSGTMTFQSGIYPDSSQEPYFNKFQAKSSGADWPWNSQSLDIVFGVSEGLLSLKRTNSGYKTGGAHSFSLTRIRE